MLELEITRLSANIEALLRSYKNLKQCNKSLIEENQQLWEHYHQLLKNNEQSKAKIEEMIEKLKASQLHVSDQSEATDTKIDTRVDGKSQTKQHKQKTLEIE